MIDLVQCEEGYEVYYSTNGMFLGHLSAMDDGFYHYFPAMGRGGYWSQEWLAALVDEMENLNAPLREQLEKDMEAGK